MKRAPKSPARGRASRQPTVMANPMAEQVGPEFHDEIGMRSALAPGADELIEASELERRCAAREVLAVAAFDGTRMFPTWQVRDGAVLDGLASVLAAMAGQPAWSVALWVSTGHDDLAGRSPRQVLEQDGPSDQLVDLAAETARRWS